MIGIMTEPKKPKKTKGYDWENDPNLHPWIKEMMIEEGEAIVNLPD
jgi:hypothetical protein